MTQVGRQLEVGFAVEASRGSAESAAAKWAKNVSTDVIAMAERADDDNSQGRLEDSEGGRVVQKWFEGPVEGIVHADMIGYLLYQLYGAEATTNPATGVYQHVFTLQQSIQHASLSIFVKDGSVQQKVYNLGVVSSLQITAAIDDYVRFSANIVAKAEASNADTPSYDTEYDFIGRDITVKIADSEAGLAGATATKIKNLTVSFDPGVIRDHVFGSYNPDDNYNAKFSIEGSFTKNFIDTTFKDLFTAGTSKYMQISIVGEADLGSGNFPTLTFLFNKVQVTDWSRAGANDDLVTEEVSFKAFYNNTDGQQSEVTLKNKTAAYAVGS